MAHQVESMMYVGETPWHGLGVKLNAPPSIEEALKQAGLDWSVSLEQLQLADGRKVDQWATVRSSDRSVLGTVGAGYRPLQNPTAFKFFQPFIDCKGATLETAGSLRAGSRVWILAKICRPDSVIVAKSDDRVAKYLLLAHGHDGHLLIRIVLTPTRVVCQNTLSVALTGSHQTTIKIRHTTGAVAALEAVQDTIERADHDFEKAADVFRALSKVRVNEKKIRQYIDAIWPRKEKEQTGEEIFGDLLKKPMGEIDRTAALAERMTEKGDSRVFEEVTRLLETGRGADMAGVKGTAWGAYNAVTEYMTWNAGRSQDNRLNSLWFQSPKPALALQAAQATFLK